MKTLTKLILSVFLILHMSCCVFSQKSDDGDGFTLECKVSFAENSVKFAICPALEEDGIVRILDEDGKLVYIDSLLWHEKKECYAIVFSRDDFPNDEYFVQCSFGKETYTKKANLGALWSEVLESPLERQELSCFAVRTFYDSLTAEDADFTDADGISFEKETGFLQSRKVLFGYEDGSFRGANKLTKAECVAIMCRIYRDKTGESLSQSEKEISLSENIPLWAKNEFAFALEVGLITEKEALEWDGNQPASAELAYRLSVKIKEKLIN